MTLGNIAITQLCVNKVEEVEKLVRSKFHQSINSNFEGCISICLDFSIQVVSNAFENKVGFFLFSFLRPSINRHSQTTMQRHRMIYSALSEEFAQGLHALSLKTKTEKEIESVQG